MRTTVRIIKISGTTILVVTAMRLFLFASFSIPTASMQPTLLPGDFILINKLIPGPRIDWPFGPGCKETGCALRFNGLKAIKQQDIIVFNAPYHFSGKIAKNSGVYYIKRCMGLPGDTLQIKGNTYRINNRLAIDNVSLPTDASVDNTWRSYKPDMFKALDWTLTSFGPVYLPRKGEIIRLDSVNIHLYKNLIEYETHGKLSFSDNTCYLNGEIYSHHAFEQNYYFVAGDNAVDSDDSRFWGLLPENHIVGKATYVWKSVDPDTRKYRFGRFLKFL